MKCGSRVIKLFVIKVFIRHPVDSSVYNLFEIHVVIMISNYIIYTYTPLFVTLSTASDSKIVFRHLQQSNFNTIKLHKQTVHMYNLLNHAFELTA